MNDTEKQQLVKELAPFVDPLFTVEGINEINWKVNGQPGHPFTIGPKHVAEASDNHHGMLGQEVCEKIPCAARKCKQPFSAHTHDTVLFLKLKCHAIESQVKEILVNPGLETIMNRNKIDGFVFVETPEKFRITKEVVS